MALQLAISSKISIIVRTILKSYSFVVLNAFISNIKFQYMRN